ncbi:Na+/H+ antiporter subunit A [Corynebacterium alimapuense]|uniref:Na+/H+ antiporter subunit A n=1 Tax=Corynebacterium alimapuense TaxID=1576874 RepID=A0A3M8K9S3_9CORY|nr:Na+/H+ antiporter subunit A [Corynebacterium alimapuense]RNE49900.1 Na+/H+ antiporter subunit A [Corynebacterium alimapuense]
MLLLLGALTIASITAPFLIRAMGRPAFGLLALVPAAGFFWILTLFTNGTFVDGGEIAVNIAWMPEAHLNLDFRLDALAGLFSLIILGVGALVLFYCWGYFDSNPHRLSMFGAQMVAFAMAMFGLVTSNNFLLMYVFWEITSVLSFLLVAYYGERASSRRAAAQALMVTTLGGLAMLVGIILLGRLTGIWRISDISTYSEFASTPHMTMAIVLILAGALTKSAIAPAHFWLPGAMAAPTPVSAYLHSAAMVKAGIYLIARLAPDFQVVATWHLVVIPLGLFTMLMAGWVALRQKDLKLILAYGTVSQLGFITATVGIGSREAMLAGLALTFAHALFKATLFMVVGAIDHTSGTRDIRELSGLGRKQPLITTLAVISAASMAGIPPLFGFVAKESVLEVVLYEQLVVGMPGNLMIVGMVLGSILTMAYSLHFLHGAFATKKPSHPSGGGVSIAVEKMHHIGPQLYLAPLVLTICTVVFGLYPAPLSAAITLHLDNIFPLADGEKATYLALWHGLTWPLLLSGIIIVGGLILHWQRDVVAKAQFDTPALGSADHAYDWVLDTLRKLSLRLTASTQRGSLSANLAIIFGVLILLPVSSLIIGDLPDVRMKLWDSPWQALAAMIIIVSAIAATQMNNRLSGVILVGVTGYSIAAIFALQGAPDLALTQTLVETIVMVIFMLVLRKLPTSTEWKQSPQADRLRAWLSVAVGLSVTMVAMFAINSRTQESIATYIPDLAKEIGHGANAVNVLLVDIRAWDTFGEISVLVVAATGVASLIYRTRSFTRPSRRPTLAVTGRRWLAAGNEDEKQQNRSLLVDVATRILFPSMIALSIYFFFAGHNAPGGGFAGGLVAALAFTLRYLAGGRTELEEALPIDAGRILGSGLIIAAIAVIWPMFLGWPPLTSAYESVDLPLIGNMSLPSALIFDTGVYLIVVGLIMHILNSLGGQLDLEEQMRKQRARDRARSMARSAERRQRAATAAASTSTNTNGKED